MRNLIFTLIALLMSFSVDAMVKRPGNVQKCTPELIAAGEQCEVVVDDFVLSVKSPGAVQECTAELIEAGEQCEMTEDLYGEIESDKMVKRPGNVPTCTPELMEEGVQCAMEVIVIPAAKVEAPTR